MNTSSKATHYQGLDGLRALAAIGIVLMHVRSNGGYLLHGFVYDSLIPALTNLVFLFMVISAFSMCCGYYEKFINNSITLGSFYGKRYAKIWPFFAVLCCFDLLLSPSKEALYETFANLTLVFGLLPINKITVIGVGWFIGTVFVFYLVFPFFCYLLSDKRRAWFAFAIAILWNIVCQQYFFQPSFIGIAISGRTNFLYSAQFFFTGGMIYLYRDRLAWFSKRYWYLASLIAIGSVILYFLLPWKTFLAMIVAAALVVVAIGIERKGILNNAVTHFLSNISMEIYLCHMVAFRLLQKLHLIQVSKNHLLSYLVAFILTLSLSIAISLAVRWGIRVLKAQGSAILSKLKSHKKSQQEN